MEHIKGFREWVSPTLKTSAFLSRGVLTPEEFVRAGDELVFKCPTWSWSGGNPKKTRSHLPADKQFLITRKVPCTMRVDSMENAFVDETEIEMPRDDEDGDGEGWLVSHVKPPPKDETIESLEDDFDVLDVNGDVVVPTPPPTPAKPDPEPPDIDNEEEEEDDDEYADMGVYEDNNVIEDNGILQTRTYDLSITYDKYYQTPRVWIFGYNEDGITPLTPDEMFQDVMSDYVKRTVTIDSHPHVEGVHASIHPCQHGKVMKNIVQNMMRSGSVGNCSGDTGGGKGDETMDAESNAVAPTVEMYLFIFLKFVSSIIPTINYDFTMEVAANTWKNP